MKSGTLILSPYFQRNLVWRETHKREFIETILAGYPFPQIFLARGEIDLETMVSFTCVVDGQQRLNAIREFISNDIEVAGKTFSQLSSDAKTDFIKYEVPVIDFDLDAGDPRLKDVFKRLNRTFYSLSAIERMATEFSASEYMLFARLLGDDIPATLAEDEEASDGIDELEMEDASEAEPANEFLRDPGISEDRWAWLVARAGGEFAKMIAERGIFTPYEFQRKVPLMFVLNIVTTILSGYYNRNLRVKKYLDDYSQEFPPADDMLGNLNNVATRIQALDLPAGSIWWNKANFFTLVVELYARLSATLDLHGSRKALLDFEADLPNDYALAAREALNNKTQREMRAHHVVGLLKYT